MKEQSTIMVGMTDTLIGAFLHWPFCRNATLDLALVASATPTENSVR